MLGGLPLRQGGGLPHRAGGRGWAGGRVMVVTRAAAVPEGADAASPEVGLVWSGNSMRLKCGTIQNQTP